jgi:hypothetical protein
MTPFSPPSRDTQGALPFYPENSTADSTHAVSNLDRLLKLVQTINIVVDVVVRVLTVHTRY